MIRTDEEGNNNGIIASWAESFPQGVISVRVMSTNVLGSLSACGLLA